MDWVGWHGAYDDPNRALSRRLEVVRSRVGDALEALLTPSPRILSLCPGDGRDLLPVLASRERPNARALLVEQSPDLARAARRNAADLGLQHVQVRCADAAQISEFADALPVDLLLLCGIFGNISDADIRTTVDATAAMTAPGGRVIWTRGSFEPDLRPLIRRWFVETGMREVSFDGDHEPFGVGVAEMPDTPPETPQLPPKLFTFLR